MPPKFDCHDFLSRLVTPKRWVKWSKDLLTPPPKEVTQELLDSYEIVDIQHSQRDSSLIAIGVSQKFLELGRGGIKAFSELFKNWASARLGMPLTAPELSPRIVDALLALKTESKYSLSPWTGTVSSTRNSLGPSWYLFTDAQPFIVGQVSSLPFQTHDTLWILPSIKKILFVPAGFESATIAEAGAQMIVQMAKRTRTLIPYLKSKHRRILICDSDCPHFGHYVWNVISAWGGFFERVQADQSGEVACANADRYFGRITEIFKTGAPSLTEKWITGVDHLYDVMFSESYLLISIHANYITELTAIAVVDHSMRCCAPGFKTRVLAMRRKHWPLVLFSLRLDNRSWVDQVEGFAELASRLREDFPDVGFFIHGLSKGVPMGWTTSWMSLEAEIQAAVQLQHALGAPTAVANAVGLSIHESVAISKLCDAFVAPLGSGMALYKWLTNKPGVVFSNRFCMDPANPDRWVFTVFDRHRANSFSSTYVPLAAVTDVDFDSRRTLSRANFTLDRAGLYVTVRNLLLSLLNLALRKPALQSSVSLKYSIGKTPAEDAKGGNNGTASEPYGFHTAMERDPWWQVDLEDSFLIHRVVIFNRRDQAERLKRFTLLGSRDGREWEELFRKTDEQVFGRSGEPFTAEIDGEPLVRLVRVRLDGEAPLHFRECQVFGVHPDPAIRARMERVRARAEMQSM